MKPKALTLSMLTSISALAALTAVVFYFTQPGVTAVAENQPTNIAPSQEPVEGEEPIQVPVKYPVAVDQHITVEVTSARIFIRGVEYFNSEPDETGVYPEEPGELIKVGIPFVEIGICYTTLDGGEWYPAAEHLYYGKHKVWISEFEFMEGEKYASSTSTGVRCAHLRYLIEDVDSVTLPMKFSIEEFYAPGREVNSPCQEIQQRWRTNPLAQEYGMKISCQDDFAKGPTVTLDDYSKSVSREDVQWVFNMLTTAEVPGQWEFVLTEIEP
ncbi:MAG: hypothetical protein R6W69_00820 [Anaerolineales bacterium]|jgi:hypothetical protein